MQRKAGFVAGGTMRTVQLECGYTVRSPKDSLRTFVRVHCKACQHCGPNQREVMRRVCDPAMGAFGLNQTSLRGGLSYGPGGIAVASSTNGGDFTARTVNAPTTTSVMWSAALEQVRDAELERLGADRTCAAEARRTKENRRKKQQKKRRAAAAAASE
jgi:hypothetical protein